ncbi:prepilin peptidase-dependent protein [Serratia sp. NPDC078593]|uniref:prepilin peptidase-dependent protein n=1 Tax=unclassified Serratia (in: enterobacteria) TaxID=2647522 RepID=UPI0037CDF457
MENQNLKKALAQRGMTLIELLVVIVLASMLTGWGVNQWRQHQQALQLEQTAQQLLAFLTRLQADANWRNRAALLWFKTGERWCIGGGHEPTSCTTAAGWFFVAPFSDVLLHDFTGKEMGFYGLRNNAQGGHIELGNSAGRIRVVLSAKGRLRLCSVGEAIRGMRIC